MSDFLEELTTTVWLLEQRVTAGQLADPEQLLEEMFQTRHGLLAVGTMATSGREVYTRMVALARHVPQESWPLMEDITDQFNRLAGLANAQREYMQGVIDYYRARTDTKMTIAAERLAVVAVVTLPITALASVYGMNIIVNETTDGIHLGGGHRRHAGRLGAAAALGQAPGLVLRGPTWAGVDSNLRRLSRQIYSLLPLATRAPTRGRRPR